MKYILPVFRGKRYLLTAALALLILIILLISLIVTLASLRTGNFADPGTGIIVIDPGHGGIDGGTNYDGLLEKEINLAVAKRLKKLLTERGFTVVLTREEDVSLDSLLPDGGSRHQKDLEARAGIINNSKAQLFLSLHVNSNFKSPNTDGSIIFYNNKYEQTKDLAYCIQDAMNGMKMDDIRRSPHNPQTADYYLLNHTNLPGVIIETAFISNRYEREMLATDAFRDALAGTVAAGVERYYEKLDIYRPIIASNEQPIGKLAIIIDDFGQDRSGVQEMMSIDRHLTMAVMPFLTFSQKDAEDAHRKGHEVIIHLPMEPNYGKMSWMGPRPILAELGSEEVSRIVRDSFESVPFAAGANIHMGSKASGNESIMSAVLDIVGEKGVYFVDSRTSSRPVAKRIADARGIPCYERDIFLDGKKPKSFIMKQLEAAMNLAAKQGKAVAIGHVGTEGGKVTSQAIEAMLPEFDRNNIRLVFVSELAD